jgi:hypothetical protein
MVQMNSSAKVNIILLHGMTSKLCSNWCFAFFPNRDSGGVTNIVATGTTLRWRTQQEYLSNTALRDGVTRKSGMVI